MKFITVSTDGQSYGDCTPAEMDEINQVISPAAEAAGITVLDSQEDSGEIRSLRDADETELDWFSEWCRQPDQNWTEWFAARA